MNDKRLKEIRQLVHDGCLNCHIINECVNEIVDQHIEIESLQAVVDELRKVIQYNFCLNPDTSDGTQLIGMEMMPMPDNVRLTIIAECMRAEAAARAAGEESDE